MQWSWLKSTYGILDLVYGSVGAPAKLSDKVVEEIKQREGDNGLVALPLERFRRGQRVRLLGGPFFGMLGLYEGLSARSRVTVLLSLLGALTPVTVPERLVEVA
jgi:transcriptional antiterminator RfaH